MKTKLFKTLIIAAGVLLVQQASAQSWLTGGNNSTKTDTLGSKTNQSVNFITNNASRVFIKSNGNVGIGTTTPQTKLDVNGDIQISNASIPMGLMTEIGGFTPVLNTSVNFREQNKNTAYKGAAFRIDSRPGQAPFQWFYRPAGSTNEYTNMVLDSAGNLGIGTTAPRGKLHVFGGNAYLWGLNIGYGTSNAIITTDAAKPIIFQQATIEKMRLDATGNLGIGTTAPHAPLQFSNATANRKIVLYEAANNDNQFEGFGLNYGALRYQVNNTGDDHIFYAGTSPTTSNELMRIKGNGNVGIGTTTPGYKLDVCGTIRSKEVRVETNWCDYVFANDYKLPALSDVETYIKENKHLPDVTSGPKIESEGLEVGKVSSQMIRKIEELTLYVIELNKKNIQLEQKNQKIEDDIKQMKRSR